MCTRCICKANSRVGARMSAAGQAPPLVAVVRAVLQRCSLTRNCKAGRRKAKVLPELNMEYDALIFLEYTGGILT